MKNIAVVYNPESGHHDCHKFIRYVSSIMNKYDYNDMYCPTQGKNDSTEIIRNLPNDIDLVLIAGGDGTLNESINGNCLREKKLPLAYIPFGTTNDVGRMYGFTKNYIKDIKLLFDGVLKQIDVCHINKKAFIYVACAGNYMNVSYETPRRLKKKYGKMAYALYGLKELSKEINKYELTYKVNGVVKSGKYTFIFVTNTSRIAGINGIYNDVKLDDKMFEVVMCKATTKKEILHIMYLLKTKNLEEIEEIEYYKTNHLEIEFKDNIPTWCLDGERYVEEQKKFVFTVDDTTEMLMPRKNIDKLFEEK